MERMLYAICSCQNLLIVSFIVSWFFLYREYVSILFFTYRVPVISEEENHVKKYHYENIYNAFFFDSIAFG